MTTIYITAQVFDGNLGEGWRDDAETAHAFADYLAERWEADLAELAETHKIEIDIEVCERTSGAASDVRVDCGEDWELSGEVEELLTTRDEAFGVFCNADESQYLAA